MRTEIKKVIIERATNGWILSNDREEAYIFKSKGFSVRNPIAEDYAVFKDLLQTVDSMIGPISTAAEFSYDIVIRVWSKDGDIQ